MTELHRRRGAARRASGALLALGLAACAAHTGPPPEPPAETSAPALPAFRPAAAGTEVLPLASAPSAVVHRGAGPEAAPAVGAGPAITVAPGGDVTLNFTETDVREFVHAVVGGILGLDYFIDPKVQGTVTVQTVRPLPRAAVLPTVERILRADGLALVEENGIVRVTPIETAQGAQGQGGGKAQAQAGLGVRVLPLRYVSAEQLTKVLEPFVAAGAVLQADGAHNVLVYSGTREDADSFSELVRTFDRDWIARTSYALVPLRAATADTLVEQLQAIIAGGSAAAPDAANALRLVPVARLNAVLVITAEPRYLEWTRAQIATLDAANEDGTERTYIYHVQFGRAADLGDVLARTFGVAVSAPSKTAQAPNTSVNYLQPTPPGANATQPTGAAGGTAGIPGTGTIGASAPTSMLGAGAAGTATATGALPSVAPLAGALTQGQPALPETSAAPLAAAQPPQAQTSSTLRIVTDDRNNALVIATTPRQYRRIEEALHRLDVKPMQVAIEATIAEVTLNDQLQFGLQWFFRQRNSTATLTNNTTAVPNQVFPGFSYMLSEANVQVILNALSAITTVKVISSPQLLVLNNQTAQLQVGQEVPVPIQQAQSTITTGAPLINTINYINTGVILTVTPRANATGEVTLDIVQEVSDVANAATAGLNAPTIDERRVQSTVSVDSGEAVALGGLIQDSVSKSRNAVPLLGDIPVLGALFRNDNNTTTRTELLVLIEPRIIRGTDDALAATQDLERRMRAIRPIPEM